MTSAADWKFRMEFLRLQARYLRIKASEFENEAARYDNLADQSEKHWRFKSEGSEVTNGK
jgi:hypothetical protein